MIAIIPIILAICVSICVLLISIFFLTFKTNKVSESSTDNVEDSLLHTQIGVSQQSELALQNKDNASLSPIFDNIFQDSKDAIAIIDTKFTILAANLKTQQDFQEIFAKSYNVGGNVLEILAHVPKSQMRARELWSRAIDGESFTCIEEFCLGSNKKRHYEMTFSPVRNEKNQITGALCISREITERVEMEILLQQSQAKLLATQKVARVGTWEFDVTTYKSQLSEEIYHICGLNPSTSEITYTQLLSLIHPQDRLRVQKAIEQAIRSGAYEEIELRVKRSDGSLKHILSRGEAIRDENGKVVKLFSANVDITEQKQAQENLLNAQENLEMEVLQRTTELRQTNEILRQEIRDRKLSESALRNSELRLGRLFESELMGIGVWEGEFVTYGNDVLCKLIGYSKEELATKTISWEAITPPEYTQLDAEKFQEVKATGVATPYEKEYIHKNGFRIPILSGACSIEEDNLSGFFFVLDNTSRKQARADLKESEERFRSTFEQAAVGIAHVSPDGRWLRVNKKICEITGYTRSELLSQNFQNITHPDDLEPDLEYVRQMLVGEISSYSMEKRYIRKDESVVWVNLTVSLVKDKASIPKYFISVIEDITEQKQLKNALEQTIRRLKNLRQLDKAVLAKQEPKEVATVAINKLQLILPSKRITIAIFDFNIETATILMTKGIGEKIAGIGFKSKLEVFSPIIEELRTGKSYTTGDISIFEPLSQMETLHSQELQNFIAIPLQIGDDLLGILKIWMNQSPSLSPEQLDIVREISDQVAIALHQAELNRQIQTYTKELETKVRERTARLEEINKELESFTYTVSHDLRAPLRALQGFATAILEDYGESLDELGVEYAQRLVSSARQMDKLIQDLLTYSRLSRAGLRLSTIDLSRIITEVLSLLETEINESQARITVCESLLKVKGNKIVLVQVISNLLSNAIKFVASQAQPHIRIWSEKRDDKIRLWVEDEGIGISKEHLDRIFRVFERLHGSETYSGTGIGLAIVRKGVERIGGSVGVESSLNLGSRFWIELDEPKET